MWRRSDERRVGTASSKFCGTGPEMSPGFQMLIVWGLWENARAASTRTQLARLRSQEREIERQLIEHTPQHDPGCAIMIFRTLAVEINLRNRHTACGGDRMSVV